jgi:polyhydroxyalkanoate synthase
VSGSWWPDYSAWLAERSGGEHTRPAKLGRGSYVPLGAAPGTYVLDR